ncbi:MAG: energy transducer TonB [Pseudomonadota bacterium]
MFFLARYCFITCVAIAITFILFFAMQLLIAVKDKVNLEEPVYYTIDIFREKKDLSIEPPLHRLEKVMSPEMMPDVPGIVFSPVINPALSMPINDPYAPPDKASDFNCLKIPMKFMRRWLYEGDSFPTIIREPIYPRCLAEWGIEGFVVLEFTVTKRGRVKNPIVLESKPPDAFDKSAIRAVLKFRYKPRIKNGEAVEVNGVRQRMTFQMDE